MRSIVRNFHLVLIRRSPLAPIISWRRCTSTTGQVHLLTRSRQFLEFSRREISELLRATWIMQEVPESKMNCHSCFAWRRLLPACARALANCASRAKQVCRFNIEQIVCRCSMMTRGYLLPPAELRRRSDVTTQPSHFPLNMVSQPAVASSFFFFLPYFAAQIKSRHLWLCNKPVWLDAKCYRKETPE